MGRDDQASLQTVNVAQEEWKIVMSNRGWDSSSIIIAISIIKGLAKT